MSKKVRINIVSLGCSKNTVDSEILAGQLTNEGFEVVFDSEKPSFDFVVINTCGFIDKAKQESINTILSFAQQRQYSKRDFKIIVFGCLAQRYKEELQQQISEIDVIFGIMQEKQIIEYIVNTNKTARISNNQTTIFAERKLSSAKHYAYLKISEGCNRRCSFCAIPFIKGKYVSKPIEDIVFEANNLVKQGVKELILIAQDTSYYGVDLYHQNKLRDLLVELCKTKVEWIRLQYTYPNEFPFEILDLMTENSKLCHYLDIPLQHINNNVLQSMNRNISNTEILSLLNKIREKVPDIALRTTLIVGYPNETKQAFMELKDFVKQVQFDRMGAFTFSKQEGTAAALLDDNISEKEKQKRLDELTDIQQEISYNLNQNKIGKTFKTIVDRVEGDYYIGRTQYDSPEVDNEVLIPIKQSSKLTIGNFYNVLITDAVEFDLYGQVIDDTI